MERMLWLLKTILAYSNLGCESNASDFLEEKSQLLKQPLYDPK